MKYHGHSITIRPGAKWYWRGVSFADVRGPAFTGTATALFGGRFATLLYACRIIAKREKAQ